MPRFLSVLVLLSVPLPALAHWAVAPAAITVSTGSEAWAHPYWDHGLVMYEDRDVFVSDRPDIAYAYGVAALGGTSSSDIRIEGIHAGIAHVVNAASHEVFVTITVVDPPPISVTAFPSETIMIADGETTTLHILPDDPSLLLTAVWYEGTVGDHHNPLPTAGSHFLAYEFRGTVPGDHRIWVEVVATDARSATLQFDVEVQAPRRRAAGH